MLPLQCAQPHVHYNNIEIYVAHILFISELDVCDIHTASRACLQLLFCVCCCFNYGVDFVDKNWLQTNPNKENLRDQCKKISRGSWLLNISAICDKAVRASSAFSLRQNHDKVKLTLLEFEMKSRQGKLTLLEFEMKSGQGNLTPIEF